ncbi:hypothetical protein R55227_BLOPHJLP_00902 [Fructobacillus tropaeoli]|nr:hypothetical protein R55227_BLOPHJLP_00902 [Fructobacillus tropaeoli]
MRIKAPNYLLDFCFFDTYFIEHYPNFTKEYFLSDSKNLELLFNEYYGRKKFFYPKKIFSEEIQQLVNNYIDNPEAELSYLYTLKRSGVNTLKSSGVKIKGDVLDAGQKVKIDEIIVSRSKEVEEVIRSKTTFQVSIKKDGKSQVDERLKAPLIDIFLDENGIYNEKWTYIIDEQDPLLHKNNKGLWFFLRSKLNLFNLDGISILPSYEKAEIGIFERLNQIDNIRQYLYGEHFIKKQIFARKKLGLFIKVIKNFDSSIESIMNWFFTSYMFDKYGILWTKFEMPSLDESVINKSSTLFRFEEYIRKQWNLTVEKIEEGNRFIETDSRLINYLNTPSHDELKSTIQNNYVELNPKENYPINITKMLFDENEVPLIENDTEGYTLFEKIQQNEIHWDNVSPYARKSIEFFVSKQLLAETSDGRLVFSNLTRIHILKAVYDWQSLNYFQLSDSSKKECDFLIR